MGVIDGIVTLALAIGAFIGGSFGWAAISGVIAGILDSVGVHIPAAVMLLAGPVVGLIAAGYVVSEVGD